MGVLRGVAPERHREVLRREAQRLTDASAGYDGQINQRRAEKYRDEDPQIQGWLRLIRGTDAELRANGGKPRPGTLNDRVQRIEAALGEPLRLVPRPVVKPKPAGVQPAGGQPVEPKRAPAPKGVGREVSAPRGYVASALQNMPAAPVPANRAPQQGGRPLTKPGPQTGTSGQQGGQPEARWRKQAREDLVGAKARPLGATTLSQLLGTFEGPPQMGVGVTPPKRGVVTTFEDAVKRAKEIAQPSTGPLPMRVPPAKPGQVPTSGQMMQQFTGTPYGPTGERKRQAYNARMMDPAYRFAGPDTFNPATWDVHRRRSDGELNATYLMAALMPVTMAAIEKRAARYSTKEKRGEVAPPPLLDTDDKRRQQQFDEIRQVRPIFEAYSSPIAAEMETKLQHLNYVQMSDMGQPFPAIRQEAERYRRDSERIVQEALHKLSREEVRKAAYRAGVPLTRFQKEVLDSVADYEQISLLTAHELTEAIGADLALNFLAGKVGGWAAAKLAARFPWLANAGTKLATKLGLDEGAAIEAKSGTVTALKRSGKAVVDHIMPGEHSVASGIAGGVQQPRTYALSDDHPTAGRLIQEAAMGFGGGLVGERAFAGAVRGLGMPGRWLAQWAEKHPSVEKVRRVLGLIGSGDIRFREGAPEPELSPRARKMLGGVEEAALEGHASAAPVLPGHQVKTPGLRSAGAGPKPAPPPRGAQPDLGHFTAPEQQPGAVGVSGEPVFTDRVLQGLAQAREAAQARIAARRSRKGPARLPRGRKGMRPGAVIGPDVVLAEVGDLFDYAFIGATHLAEGVVNPKVWDLQMVKTVGEEIEPHLEQIRELARRIHQGWKEYKIPTQGARVREAARAYLQKLAANASTATEPAPGASAAGPARPLGKATAPALPEDIKPDARLVRNGKLVPEVEKVRRAALERLRRGTGQWQYGVPDSATFRDYAFVGATYMAKGFKGDGLREAWKERMRADLGREVEPHLDWIWKTSEDVFEKRLFPGWKKRLTGGVHTPEGTVPKATGEAGNPVTPFSPRESTPTGQGTYRRGRRINGGGEKEIYLVEGRDDLVVGLAKDQGHRANLEVELGRLRKLKELGLPVVEPIGIFDIDGRPGLVMPRYEVGSKAIVKLVRGTRKLAIVGNSKYLNARSIRDLEQIRAMLIDKEISIADLQFLIGRDGQVVINDPQEIVRKKPSDANKRTISLLIRAAQENGR